jgi:ribosomal protein L11 methyltransferase
MNMNAQDDGTLLTLETDGLAIEALEEHIRDHLGVEPVQILRPGDSRIWLDLYFNSDVEARLAEQVLGKQFGIRASVIKACKSKDWQAFWRRHFHRRQIGRRLLICPVWDPPSAGEERISLLINPGLSFGTGDHFTTRFCLEMIDRVFEESVPASFMDVGTGSGILAIAAARLGCSQVAGADYDEIALRQAEENVALNGVSDGIRMQTFDITRDRLDGVYEVVCANLYSSLLTEYAGELARATGRYLILSGMRESEADGVVDAFLACGLREVVRDGDGEWCGLMLRKS